MLCPAAQIEPIGRANRKRRDSVAAQGRIGDIHRQWPAFTPGVASRPNRPRNRLMPRPDISQFFFKNHIQSLPQPQQMLCWRSAAEILIKIVGIDSRVPVPIGTHPRHRIARCGGLFGEKHKGNAWRSHQTFLTG